MQFVPKQRNSSGCVELQRGDNLPNGMMCANLLPSGFVCRTQKSSKAALLFLLVLPLETELPPADLWNGKNS